MNRLTEWLLGLVAAYYFVVIAAAKWLFPEKGKQFFDALTTNEFLLIELGPLLLAILIGVVTDWIMALRQKRKAEDIGVSRRSKISTDSRAK
jgi:hypothetical protein